MCDPFRGVLKVLAALPSNLTIFLALKRHHPYEAAAAKCEDLLYEPGTFEKGRGRLAVDMR